nr:60S ribosomal protein L5-like [Tanacetum cinerariifolium]
MRSISETLREPKAIPCSSRSWSSPHNHWESCFGPLKGALDGGIDIPHSEKRFAGYSKDGKQLDVEVYRKYIYSGHVASYMRVVNGRCKATYWLLVLEPIEGGVFHFSYKRWPPRVTLGRLLPHARGLGFMPRRGGFPSGAKKEWGLTPKANVRVLHTAELDVTAESQRHGNFDVNNLSVETKCSDSETIESNFLGKWASLRLTLIEENQATIELG